MIPKNKRIKDKKYMRKLCDYFGCIICNDPDSAPHHITGYKLGGMATKPDDYLVIPLCNRHHSASSERGIHKDFKRWEQYHSSQPSLVIMSLNVASRNGWISSEKYNKYKKICKGLIKIN